MTSDALETQAREAIKRTGGRQTQPRIQVLTCLLHMRRAVTHAELQEHLPDMDRVSLYRALDWLAEQGLAFKLMDADGHRRYGPSEPDSDHRHAHFQCTDCGMTTCLGSAPTPSIDLPTGYQMNDVEVLVTGTCPKCCKA